MMFSIVLAVGMLIQSGPVPAPVTARYSCVYDEQKHRQHLPNCPEMEEVQTQVAHAITLWEQKGGMLLERIRTASAVDGFPAEPVVVYFIGCGRGISDPLTVSVYTGGPGGPFVPRPGDEILQDVVHELFHHIAVSDAYDTLWWELKSRHHREPPLVFNHIIVLMLEARVYGYASVRERYRRSPAYARALELAVAERLIPDAPPGE